MTEAFSRRNGRVSAGALVLAGGRGQRLGGTDKADLRAADGRRLIDRAVEALTPVCPRGVAVLRGEHEPLDNLPCEQLWDPGLGPVGALCVGLEAALTRGHHVVMALAVDIVQPCVPLLVRMAEMVVEDDHQVVLPEVDGRLQPLHAAWSTSAAATIGRALRENRLRVLDVLDELDVRVLAEADWTDLDPHGHFAWDVDQPEDLDLLTAV